jgi:hypothetical protein
MVNTFVVLFWRMSLLDAKLAWSLGHGYEVARVDASTWTTEADLHRDLAAALNFPPYYGKNFRALNECLHAVASYDYGTSPEASGFVLALTGYDRFARLCPVAAYTVLDLFAKRARAAALIGHRMVCLVQSDDPDLSFEPVGAMPVMWNDAEWLNANRRAT